MDDGMRPRHRTGNLDMCNRHIYCLTIDLTGFNHNICNNQHHRINNHDGYQTNKSISVVVLSIRSYCSSSHK